ncbi:hypothetical protein [Actinomadura pelletieri]|uniref:hypothetical protein n=1 Tax=Actinomadura pelletieri TaxID=111805 RepID=UPI001476E0FE|nr:hypothetical protein [Actinomadura pelletieri]
MAVPLVGRPDAETASVVTGIAQVHAGGVARSTGGGCSARARRSIPCAERDRPVRRR